MIQHPGFKSCYSKLRLACNLTQPTSPRLTDGTLIDGNDSKLSRILFTSVHGRDRVGLSPLCDLSWLRDRKTGLRRPVNPLNIGQIGENIVLRRGVTLSAGEGVKLAGVTHPSANINPSENHVQFGRYGTVVAYTNSGEGIIPEGQTVGKKTKKLFQSSICVKVLFQRRWPGR